MGSWQGAGWWGCLGWRGCFNVFDKGSHFLVSHFLGWETGRRQDGGSGGVGQGGLDIL